MYILIFNSDWMAWNIFLALTGPVFAWFAYHTRKSKFTYILWFLWLLFIPNSIYLITDVEHLLPQLYISSLVIQILLVIQYLILIAIGIGTYVMGMYYFQVFFGRQFKYFRRHMIPLMIMLNFVIAFGVTMGRFQRTNSWHILTDFGRVISDIINTATSGQLLLYTFCFAMLINVIYFFYFYFMRPASTK
jgi:uncharacterized membrane protein